MSLATPSLNSTRSSVPQNTSATFSSLSPSTVPSSASPTFSYTQHPHYTFPPFFTLQPNLNTRAAQLSAWSSLLTSYCQHEHLFRLGPRHPIFHNAALNRRLQAEDVTVLFAYMREKGTALSVVPAAQKARGWYGARSEPVAPAVAGAEEIFVLWRSLDEWAGLILDWVEGTGQRGAVLTVFEMTEGEQSRGKEWEGMPSEVVRRVVEVLVRRNKAALIGEDEGLGVKFF